MKKINVLNLSIGGPDFLDVPFVDKARDSKKLLSGLDSVLFLLQGGPSGRVTQFVDIKLKVPPQYELHIQSGVAYHSQGFED